MIQSAALILGLLVLGEAVAERAALPFPGAALGLAALTLGFAARGGADDGSEALFDLAAPYFPLFFVPAAVGVLVNLDLLAAAWLQILLAVTLGTALALATAGLLFQAMIRRLGRSAEA